MYRKSVNYGTTFASERVELRKKSQVQQLCDIHSRYSNYILYIYIYIKKLPTKTRQDEADETKLNADTYVQRQKQNLSDFLPDTLVEHPGLAH